MFFARKKAATPKKKAGKPKKAAEPPGAGGLSAAQIKAKLQDGWFRVLITFELVGKPEKHVEETLKAYLANIESDGRVTALHKEWGAPEEHEDGMFSAFCEFECLVNGLDTLTWLSVNFMPAAIEVLEPDSPVLEARSLNHWFNDLLAKLHETSTVVREQRTINQHLTESLNALIQNSILLAAKEPLTAAGLAKATGVAEKQLAEFLKHMTEKGRLVQEGDAYRVAS